MSNADGGPAFPRPFTPGSGEKQDGMSLHDYFAGKALQGLIVRGMWIHTFPPEEAERLARDAHILADAMLAEREKE